MNHGYDDEDNEIDDAPPPQARAGPSGLLAQLMGGFGGHMGYGGYGMNAPPSAYDEYFKAYSVAVMGGTERPEVMYGGKIIMPPSALAKLSGLDIQSPWSFHLRNPRNPTEHHTHAGVLEFIASEGVVHLPAWMMKTLNLNEGDPIRITGAALPKGKLVKLQAQSTDFLQVSDPRAVLESALRSYSVITKNSIIEITYNSLTFEFRIVEVEPTTDRDGGISVLDTDLEVDFDVPVGYVEPPRPEPKAIPTMADKLKIDLGGTTAASAGSSRPASSLGGGSVGSEGGTGGGEREVFSGMGQSLSGRRVKGKGLSKKIEEVDPSSRIIRNDKPRIITPSSLSDDPTRQVPAVLTLPPGKFFFGYKYTPYDPSKAPKPKTILVDEEGVGKGAFGGEGMTLKGKRKATESEAGQGVGDGAGSARGKRGEEGEKEEKEDPWAEFGAGNTLKKGVTPAPTTTAGNGQATGGGSVARAPATQPDIIDATMLDEDDFWEAEEGSEDEEAYIEVDSD